MNIADEGDDYVVFDEDGMTLIHALPDESVDGVLADMSEANDDFAPLIAKHLARVVRPGGYIFLINWWWGYALDGVGLDVYSDRQVCIAGKPPSSRPLYHAVTCTEDRCDDCSISRLAALSNTEFAMELVPFIATGGTVAIPWGRSEELIQACQRHHRKAMAARET